MCSISEWMIPKRANFFHWSLVNVFILKHYLLTSHKLNVCIAYLSFLVVACDFWADIKVRNIFFAQSGLSSCWQLLFLYSLLSIVIENNGRLAERATLTPSWCLCVCKRPDFYKHHFNRLWINFKKMDLNNEDVPQPTIDAIYSHSLMRCIVILHFVLFFFSSRFV